VRDRNRWIAPVVLCTGCFAPSVEQMRRGRSTSCLAEKIASPA
jgi:hypothetical protein